MVVSSWGRASGKTISKGSVEVILSAHKYFDHDGMLEHDFRAGGLFIAEDALVYLDGL